MLQASVDRFVHNGMLILEETATAKKAARAMHERRVGSVVVCDHHGKVVGILTDRDLSTQVLAFDYSPLTPIKEFMATDIFSISDRQTVGDAIALMRECGIRRIPIVHRYESGKEKCVGMVTLDDLIAEKAIDLETLSQIVAQQVVKPRRKGVQDGMRHEAKLEQTLNRFNSIMAKHTHLSKYLAEDVSFYLLSTVVQRLSATNAVHLISQLPSLLQYDLLNLKAGPNLSINSKTILTNLTNKFELSTAEAKTVLNGFWEGLKEFTEPGTESAELIHSLPAEFSL